MLTISIGIATFNRKLDLIESMKFFEKQTRLPDEIIISDSSGEYEETHQILLSSFPDFFKKVPLKYFKSEVGSSIQRNDIIDQAKTDILAFLDDDARIHPSYIKKIMEVFEADSQQVIGGVEGSVFSKYEIPDFETGDWSNKPINSNLGFKGLVKTKLMNMIVFLEGSSYPKRLCEPCFKIPESCKHLNVIPCSNLYGCAMNFRTKILKNEFRFNAQLKRYAFHEDFELSYRIGRKYGLVKCLDALVIHLYSPSGRLDESLTCYLFLINIAYIARRIFPYTSEVINQVSTYAWRRKWLEFLLGFSLKKGFNRYRGFSEGYRETLNILKAPPDKVEETYRIAADRGFNLKKF